jgi:Fe2+ or Zn2+ uptake regulation protein
MTSADTNMQADESPEKVYVSLKLLEEQGLISVIARSS